MLEDLEQPACPMCEGVDLRRSFEGTFKPYALAHCEHCHFYFLSPRPKQTRMAEVYRAPTYYAGEAATGYGDYARQSVALGMTFERMLRWLERRGLTEGNLLEVGCGYGYFLQQARSRFRSVEATEMSPHAACAAEAHADRVFLGGIDEVPEGERYDLIVALQVLEHVYQPRAFVRSLASRLRRGGYLLLGVPDMGSPWRHLLGARWPSFKIPEHVLYFDRSSLMRLMREEGLGSVHTVPYPHAFPLPLLTAKAGLRLSPRFDHLAIWVPRTALAAIGRA